MSFSSYSNYDANLLTTKIGTKSDQPEQADLTYFTRRPDQSKSGLSGIPKRTIHRSHVSSRI